jgi:hypothetical protein
MTFLAKASLLLVAISLPGVMANSSAMAQDARALGEVIFILNGPENPTEVQRGVQKHLGQNFMRLPDLGVMSQKPSQKKLFKGKSSSTIHRKMSGDTKIETAQTSSDHKQTFKFKPTKVSVKPKLPSIKFSSFRPTLELYEETPSLDFTGKSLKDGGF